jgi:hypothetical protein
MSRGIHRGCDRQVCRASCGPEVSRKCADSLPDVMNMRNRVSICTLIIGLICPFTQVARERRAAGSIWDDWRKVRRCSRTPFRIGPANATAFRQWRSWLRWGGFEPPTFGLSRSENPPVRG